MLVPFPFTDLRRGDKRPALVVNIEEYQLRNTDILVAPITSKLGNPRYGDHLIGDWRGAGLLLPSIVRAKVATIRASMVARKLGEMPTVDLTGVEGKLRQVMAL